MHTWRSKKNSKFIIQNSINSQFNASHTARKQTHTTIVRTAVYHWQTTFWQENSAARLKFKYYIFYVLLRTLHVIAAAAASFLNCQTQFIRISTYICTLLCMCLFPFFNHLKIYFHLITCETSWSQIFRWCLVNEEVEGEEIKMMLCE